MEFGVLGPISAWADDGELVPVGGPRQRCILGALLVDLGKEVTVERLIDYLWDDDPPRTARSVIQVQISHLRRAFPELIETTPGGYLAQVAPERVDLHRFRDLVARAQVAVDAAEAVVLWDRALACWRGRPFSGTGSDQLWYTVSQPLLEERWAAVTGWAECAFSLHRYSEIVTRLTPLVREEPLRERLQYLLMAALHRSGQRASALTTFHETRSYLADELGVDPSPAVMELYQRILQDEEDTADNLPESSQPLPSGTVTTTPSQGLPAERATRFVTRNDLPRDIPDFTGRDHHVRELTGIGESGADRAEVAAIVGSGGAGKTTLSVHAAHQLAERYPDGQLFIDLHGFTVGQQPMSAAAALGSLLRAVGVDPDAVPESQEERSALWRSVLAGRRILVLLDNAANYGQVSPLLPAAAGSLTVVTTRNDLPGLSGARHLSLGVLGEASSLALFSTVLGEGRVAAEPEHAREVVRLCGELPLALRIVAGRMLSRPRWTFTHVEQRLREQQRRFHELRVDGQSVAGVFELSYQSLNEPQRETFLLLGAMIGSIVDLHGAAALLNRDPPDADDLLQELVSVCLLEETGVDVYRFHELIGAYARQKVADELEAVEINAARRRLADHYLDMANRGADWLGPRAHEYETGTPEASRYRNDLSSRKEVLDWFDTHQDNLAAAVDFYASIGSGDRAWKLADSLWRFYASHAQTELLLSTHETALAISRAQGNDRGSAVTLIGMGIAHCLAGRFDVSLSLLNEALSILNRLGDDEGKMRVFSNLATVYERQGKFHHALSNFWKVLEYAIQFRDRRLELLQRSNIAIIYETLGDYEKVVEFAEAALAIADGDEQSDVQASTLRVLGEVYTQRGAFERAYSFFERALELARSVGSHPGEIYIHNGLAVAQREDGDVDAAITSHTHALELGERSAQRSAEAEILVELGTTYARAERHAEARTAHEQALKLARERDERHIEGKALLGLGSLPPDFASPEETRSNLSAAAAIFGELGVPEEQQAWVALRDSRDGC